MKPTLLVLAAGMGSRFGGLKQITPVGPSGEWILDYSVYDAIQAGFDKVVFVIREETRDAFQVVEDRYGASVEVDFAFQRLDDLPNDFTPSSDREKPWGTGHAVYAARNSIDGPFAVINADDFYGQQAYDTLAKFLSYPNEANSEQYSLVGYQLENTLSATGSVSRGICRIDSNGSLDSVEEYTDIRSNEDGSIEGRSCAGDIGPLPADTLVSLNCWGFTKSFLYHLEGLFVQFLEQRIHEPKSEFYLPFAVDSLIKNNLATVLPLRCGATWLGVTHRTDLKPAQERISRLVERGDYPSPLWSR